MPPGLLTDLVETMGRYGRLVLRAGGDGLELTTSDPAVLEEVVRSRKVAPHLGERLGPDRVAVPLAERGRLKQALLALGWPADDKAGYVWDPSRQNPTRIGWGRQQRPGTAKMWVYNGCQDQRVVADVLRLDKGHTEGLEPKVTEEIVKLMVSARGGKIQHGG